MTGFQFVHVPYKGGGPAVLDVIAGRAQAIFGSAPFTGPHAKSGRLRAIATGHSTRIAYWPELPAIAETLPGFSNTTWFGLLGPAGMPKPIVDRINSEMKRAVANPDFARQLTAMGLEPASSTPAEFHDMIRTELQRWTRVIREAGITAESAQ
jgi:tripartite-type tricarboxylate transporter receptor subunit TctC